VAIATALSESALAIVRTSGKGAIELAVRVFSSPMDLTTAASNTLTHGWIVDDKGALVDEVLAAVFRPPNGFTGEDSVEFTCHGGIAVVKAVLRVLVQAGFRQALPGEFSFRAFVNGKLDLTRAESIMELVASKTDEARSRAVERLSGALEREIVSVKTLLVDALTTTELLLDYSEDDGVPDAPEGEFPERAAVVEAKDLLAELAASYRLERLYREGATVAVAGRPNAGKSSLFNRLVKEERSIVSETPGTTRDWIEAWVSIHGIPVRLVDTAGLREAPETVERQGVERSKAILKDADLTVYLVDGAVGEHAEDAELLAGLKPASTIRVWNKADISGDAPQGYLAASTITGQGIHELGERIAGILESLGGGADSRPGSIRDSRMDIPGGSMRVGIASARQKELVDRAVAAVTEALKRADSGLPLDLVAPELREAVDALGEITGEVTSEQILHNMFGRFCVGK
jgi:tRNA modification GTPase